MTVDNEVYEGFDSAIGAEADEGGFVLLPSGKYPYRATRLERERYDGGEKVPACWKAVVTLEVDGGDAGTAYVAENIFLTKKSAWKIKQLFVSCGLVEKGAESFVPPWNDLVGSGGMLELKQRSFKGRDGDDVMTNDVKKFLDPEEAAKAMLESSAATAAPDPQPSFNFPAGA